MVPMHACVQAAIKFYLQRAAFDSEKELYMDPQLYGRSSTLAAPLKLVRPALSPAPTIP